MQRNLILPALVMIIIAIIVAFSVRIVLGGG